MSRKIFNKTYLLNNYAEAYQRLLLTLRLVFEVCQVEAADNLPSAKALATMDALYEFGTHGRISQALDSGELMRDAAHIFALLNAYSEKLDPAWKVIYTKAQARDMLENELPLSIAEVVALAEVDERTVRNAISANQLPTTKMDGKVYVPSDDALDWLKERRYFTATVFID